MEKKKIIIISAVAFVLVVAGAGLIVSKLFGTGDATGSNADNKEEQPKYLASFKIDGNDTEVDFTSCIMEDGPDVDSIKALIENNVPKGTKKPKNAYFNKKFELVPEKKGDKVDIDKLSEDVKEKINSNAKTEFNIEDYYETAKITTESDEILKISDAIEKFEDMKIKIKFGKKKEVISWENLRKHVKYKKKKAKLAIDKKWVTKYVKKLAKTYNTFGKTRKFKTTKDGVKKIKGGILGWWIDEPKTVKKLNKVLSKHKSKTIEPIYKNRAVKHGKDDIGDTYVEVSIGRQHCWFYKKGKLKMESDVVSGLDTPSRRTTRGAHRIFAMQRERYLGTYAVQGYHTLVHYWMPFDWDGQGLHDATWRGSFGGSIYKYNGSHGCVNLPYSFAAKLYSKVTVGTPVIVY